MRTRKALWSGRVTPKQSRRGHAACPQQDVRPPYNRDMPSPTSVAGGALRVAFDLAEAGIALMRQNLRRRFPEASEDDIDQRLRAWVQHRPGAEQGDAAGRPVDPRSRFG